MSETGSSAKSAPEESAPEESAPEESAVADSTGRVGQGVEPHGQDVDSQEREGTGGDRRRRVKFIMWFLFGSAVLFVIVWLLLPGIERPAWMQAVKSHLGGGPSVSLQSTSKTSPKRPAPEPRQEPEPSSTVASSRARTAGVGFAESLKRLSQQIESLREQQSVLIRSLRLQQKTELRVLLRRLAREDLTPYQMALDWRDLAAMPILDAAERSTASDLWRRSEEDAEKISAWRKQLRDLASQLRPPPPADVLPEPKTPLLSWLGEQFRLRRVPQGERRELMRLRTTLLEIEYGLGIGAWPPQQKWRRLLQAVRRHFNGGADLGLPTRFEGIRKDIEKMRAVAASWLKRL